MNIYESRKSSQEEVKDCICKRKKISSPAFGPFARHLKENTRTQPWLHFGTPANRCQMSVYRNTSWWETLGQRRSCVPHGEASFKTIRFTAFPPLFETHKLCLCSRLSTSEDKLYFAVNSAAWAPLRGFGWLQHLPAWHSCWGYKQFTSNKSFFGG